MYSAFVYSISLKEEPVYFGYTLRYNIRRSSHANTIFHPEKDDFVMRILYKVQSVEPAAAVFLAESLESWLQAYATENGVTLRGEQNRFKYYLFRTPKQTREIIRNRDKGIKEAGITYPCTWCDKIFNCHSDLTAHKRDVHSKKKAGIRYPCGQCYKIFSREVCRNAHEEKVHSGKEKEEEVKCGKCDKIYKDKFSLTRHDKNKHSNNGTRVRYPCTICGTSFTDKSNLRRHIENAHSNNGAGIRYPCTICGKSYSSKSNRRQHETNAHPEKEAETTFPCGQCDKIFTCKIYRNVHVKDVHSTNGAGVTCTKCYKILGSKRSLTKHEKIMHSEKESSSSH